MEDQENSENVEIFLAALGESLRSRDDVDKDLVKILKENILKVSPTRDVVTEAMQDILELATSRAESIEEKGMPHE